MFLKCKIRFLVLSEELSGNTVPMRYIAMGILWKQRGRIQDFHGGGGAQRKSARMLNERKARSPIIQPGYIKGPWKFLGCLMLSRAIWALYF